MSIKDEVKKARPPKTLGNFRIEKHLWDSFRAKLKRDKIKTVDFFRVIIQKYLQED